jgi:YfiH family protein
MAVIRLRSFSRPGVRHGFSTRGGGISRGTFASLNLGLRVGDDPEAVVENRRRFLASVGLLPGRTVGVQQVHGTRVVTMTAADGGAGVLPDAPLPEAADALITDTPGLGLLVLAADCVPLLFWDPVRRAVGAAHAGWRGSVAGIAVQTVAAMAAAFGCRPGDLVVGIGPAIGGCCYEVDGPVLTALDAQQPGHATAVTQPSARPDRRMLDLKALNRLQLTAAGVPPASLEVSDLCTACHSDLLFSERRLGRPCGRLGAAIALEP